MNTTAKATIGCSFLRVVRAICPKFRLVRPFASNRSLSRTSNPSSSSTPNLPLDRQKVRLPYRHPASCCLECSHPAAALAGSTCPAAVPAGRIVPVVDHIALVADRTALDPAARMGCCRRSSLRWTMADRAGCRSMAEADHSPGLERVNRRAQDRRHGGWEEAIADKMAVRLGPWGMLVVSSQKALLRWI